MGSSIVGAYWGDRRESAAECGERLARCIADLGHAAPVLGTWFELGSSRVAAKERAHVDAEALGGLFADGSNRRDAGGEVIEHLGFRIGLWNRARPEVGLSAHAGSYANHPGILNSFVLKIPAPDEGAEILYRSATATAVFEAAVAAWEPEWATWTTLDWRNPQSPRPREPVVGWLTYLADSEVPALPHGTVRAVDGGVLIQAAPEFGAVDETTVLAIHRHLRESAALRPIP